jgi:hypothetical protein
MSKKARLSKMAQDLKPETQNDINTELQQTKVKATYTLSADLLASLETGQTKLRTMVKPKIRGQINRSLLVELAVKAALIDLTTNGTESQIYRHTENHLSGFPE